MVALDVRGIVGARFYHVGIDRALRQKFAVAVFFRLVLKNVHEFRADDLALLFGIDNARKFAEKAFGSVHVHEVQIHFGKAFVYFLALVLAHETVIDIDADELIRHRLGYERRADR